MFNIRVGTLAKRLSLTLAGAAVTLMSLAGPSQADLTFVSTRAALGGNDFIDWGTAGAAPFVVPNPLTMVSFGGLSAVVSEPLPNLPPFGFVFSRSDQGNGWGGNFAPGDHLLFTNGPFGPITIDLASPVWGIGTQVQRNRPGAFTGLLEVFDSGNVLLASFDFSGFSNDAADNSAVFVGVRSDTPDIKKVVYGVFGPDPEATHNFAINQVDLVTVADARVVPEPGSLALLFTGCGPMVLALARRRRGSAG
jgi:hypothetical protein